MDRRHIFGGLFRLRFCFALFLGCHAVSCGYASQGADFQAQGRICMYVNLQKEFDLTVRAVKGVLDVSDEHHQEKLNRTIYKGLLNHVISQSIMYPVEIQEDLPKAEAEVVKELEEAGFVTLANLARKDWPGSTETNDHAERGSERVHPCSKPWQHVENGEEPSDHKTPCGNYPHIEDRNQHVSFINREHYQTPTDTQTPGCCPTTHTAVTAEPTVLASSSSESGTPQESPTNKNSLSKVQQTNSKPAAQAELTTPLGANQPMSGEMVPEHGQDSPANWDARGRLVNRKGWPIIEDDLYWSAEIDAATPKGFSQEELDAWKARVSKQSVRSFEPGSLEKCGKGKNRFIVLEDGSKLCARYRYPFITSMTGELNCYHLARMLGLTNLPPLAAATTNSSLWRGQGSNFEDAEWEDGKIVLLSKWIDDLDKAYLPEILVQGPFPVGARNRGLRNLTIQELTTLLQWSDLLLFDYLIAHFDRLVINLTAVKHYNNTSLMRTEVHNLVQHPQTKQLWIVDNESGLVDGYSFLLVGGRNDSRLQGEFHEELLQMICVFRRSTAEGVRRLLSHPNPAELLTARVLREDPVSEGAFPAFSGIKEHTRVLRERLARIQAWMEACRERNSAARGT